MIINQISVFIENKEGRLAELLEILAGNNIDIRALSIADTADFGILRLIVNDPERAMNALEKEGVTVSKTQVIGVKLNDAPGALAHVLNVLSRHHISVEYTYAFITHSKNEACVILRVEDNDKAINILNQNGIELLRHIN
ncbi:MAG: acetolactate synthase [Clostridiales bacterium]|jgi:hypothetical protein|nr:acetolactate synthase [Clostridiales bacterium]